MAREVGRLFKAKHDRLILGLLASGLIAVEETPCSPPPGDHHQHKNYRNVIKVRSRKDGLLRCVAISYTGFGGAPRFVVRLHKPEKGRAKAIWLSARRVVWLFYRKKPSHHNICPIDDDQMNYSFWNLVERDQLDQNLQNLLREAGLLEDAETRSDPEEPPF
jgi:hypothetical protein